MVTIKTALILLCSILASPVLRSQYTIRQWNVEDGLPQSTVRCITQTHDGYLWVGTWNGLARFDGVRMTAFTAANSPGFNPSVTSVHEDRSHHLWVGTDGGGLFQYRDGKLVRIDSAAGFFGSIVCAMDEDSAGRMWFGTDHGIFIYSGNRFLHFPYSDPFPNFFLQQVQPAPDGSVFLGFVEHVFHVRLRNDSLILLEQPFIAAGYRFDVDSSGTFWYSAKGKGLGHRVGSVVHFDSRLAEIDPLQVFIPRNQERWVLTRHGPYIVRENHIDHIQFVDGIDLSNIEYVFEDREGIIWIAVEGSGLLRLLPKQVQTYSRKNGLETDELMCGMEDRSGSVWMGTWLGGLVHAKLSSPERWSPVAPLSHGTTVMAVCQSVDGTIWVGTWARGGYTIRNGQVKSVLGNGLENNTTIRAIVSDPDGSVWIAGVYGALWHVKNGQVTLWNSKNGLTASMANSLLITRRGEVWMGTEGSGIARVSNGHISFLRVSDGLIDGFCRVAIEDDSGAVWLISKRGIQRWKEGKLSSISSAQGFDDDAAQFIQDDTGDYWIGGTHGIHRIRREDLNAAADGLRSTVNFLTVGKADGMPVQECSGGSNQHTWKTHDGTLWFSTTHGVVRLDPRHVASNPVPPGVNIEEVQIEHRPVPLEQEIVLQPQETKVEFRYTGINFSSPDQIRFQYMLSGFDDTWREVDGERYAQYTNLSPGTYTFRVKAANNAGIWNETGASVAILVLPPFWATWWFRGVTILLFLTVGPAIYAFRVRQLKAERERQSQFSRRLMQTQEAERQRIANELHDSLGQNLLVIKNKLLMAEQDRGGHNGLGEMSDLVSKTIEEVRSISHNLRPHQLDQLGVTKTIRALAKQVGESSGIPLSADVQTIDGLLTDDEEINLFRIVQECCNNLVKHSGATGAKLSLKRTDGRLEFTLSDNGHGMDALAEQSRESLGGGFGLSGMRERARTFGWNLDIESQPERGTTIRLLISLVEKQ